MQVRSRENLLIFLKGSKEAKMTLKLKEPEQYSYFQSVWDIRSRHMITGLPLQYVFMLVCCYQPHCCHPVCKTGRPTSTHKWYSGGPPVTKLPLPVVDEERSRGSACESCAGTCLGHYKTVLIDVTDQSALSSIAPPPSTVLKEEFSKAPRHQVTGDLLEKAAKKALLSTDDARIWLEHLQTVL